MAWRGVVCSGEEMRGDERKGKKARLGRGSGVHDLVLGRGILAFGLFNKLLSWAIIIIILKR
jgi:hypothetical protein